MFHRTYILNLRIQTKFCKGPTNPDLLFLIRSSSLPAPKSRTAAPPSIVPDKSARPASRPPTPASDGLPPPSPAPPPSCSDFWPVPPAYRQHLPPNETTGAAGGDQNVVLACGACRIGRGEARCTAGRKFPDVRCRRLHRSPVEPSYASGPATSWCSWNLSRRWDARTTRLGAASENWGWPGGGEWGKGL